MVFTTSDITTETNEDGIEVPIGGRVAPLGFDGDCIALPPGASEKDVRWTIDGDVVVKGAFYLA